MRRGGNDGAKQDMKIEHKRPIVDVIEVVVDALLHLLVSVGLSPIAMNLRPSGDAGFDVVPPGVEGDATLVLPIVSQRMRARPDERHVALDDVEQLRKLIDAQRSRLQITFSDWRGEASPT
jgi:hypothetical protein